MDVAKVGVVDPLARRVHVPPEGPSRVSFINFSPSAKMLNHGLLPYTQTGRCGVFWKGYQAHKAWGLPSLVCMAPWRPRGTDEAGEDAFASPQKMLPC